MKRIYRFCTLIFLMFFLSCETEDSSQVLPTLSTNDVIQITNTSASSGGNIIEDGDSDITQRGVVWSTNPNPTTADMGVISGYGSGSFTSDIFSLSPSTTYYLRAYATNGAGTSYGNEQVFTTSQETSNESALNPDLTYDSVTDVEGNSYATIVIGNQNWMAENLRVSTYANGDPIPNETVPSDWINYTSGAWSYYNNDSQYEIPYGKLYNWYVVSDYRNVCPAGWHVPSDQEWSILFSYVGGPSLAAEGSLKSEGTLYWQAPNSNATNTSGFSGVGGGFLGSNEFAALRGTGTWWSSTQHSPPYAWARNLISGNGFSGAGYAYKQNGFSIRCIED